MKKIKPRFKSLLLLTIAMAVLLLTGCPVAPPTEPMDQYRPYLSPEAVKTLTATNGYEDSIMLKWDEVPNATSYQVWKIEASDYGAVSNPVNSDASYDKLRARGFELMDITEGTSYKMTDCKHNEAYVFTVIAMRSVGTEGSKSVLFSDIGNYCEGSTIGDIAFTAVSLADEIILSWQVNNLYDVLYTRSDASSAEKKPLFDNYGFTVSYRSADDSSYTIIDDNADASTEEIRRINILENGLRLNSKYYFKVAMTVYEGSSEIGHVESFEFPVNTTSKFSISAIDSITVSEGSKVDAIDVTWRAPSVPLGVDYRNIFEVQRAVVPETGAEPVWITVLDVDTYKAKESEIATPEDKVYTWSDTSGAENTKYNYRVINGYVIDDKDVWQDSRKPITVSKNSGYKLWRPTDIKAEFTKAEGNPDTGKLTITWNLDIPQKDAKWELSETKWYEKGNVTTTAPAEGAVLTSEGVTYTYTYDVNVDDLNNLSIFKYSLVYKYGDEALEFKITTKDPISLGKSTTKKLFTDLKASNDLVGMIKLEWKLDPVVTDDLIEGTKCPYELTEDDKPIAIVYENIVRNPDGSRSYEIATNGAHSYRLKLTGSYDGAPVSEYIYPLAAEGDVLSVPVGLSVTDSSSRDRMTVTWVPNDNVNVRYFLEYREKGLVDDIWKDVPVEASVGTVEITKEMITPEKAGAVFEFKMRAINETAPGSYTAWTPVEEGSIFGSYGMNLEVVENGLDPDAINLKWNPVVGAEFYKVVRDGEAFSGNGTAAASYADTKIIGIKPDESNKSPLSKEYTYKVIPYMTREEADDDTSFAMSGSGEVKGKLFAPPVGIKASKGEFTKEIHVTWDPVVIEGQDISYEVFKYVSADVYPSKESSYSGTATEFIDKIATDGVYYAVRTVRQTSEGPVKSHWQTSFDDFVNEVGETEPANYGYRLNMPSGDDFRVNEVTTVDGKYADYVKLVWKRVPGATEYRIYNSILAETGIDIPLYEKVGGTEELKSVFVPGTTDMKTNGKKADEAGYLAYDVKTGIFTYNDNSGVMIDKTVINGYALAAKNDIQVTGRVEEGTSVHRMFKPEECVNLVNLALNPLIDAADKSFKHDWWGSPSAPNYDGKNGFTVERYSETADGTWFADKNLMKLKNVMYGEFKLSTTVPIQYFINYTYDIGAGYLGTDPLVLIGKGNQGTIQVEHPNYRKFSVTFKEVKYDDYVGAYDVVIDTETFEVKDSEKINRPFVEVRK